MLGTNERWQWTPSRVTTPPFDACRTASRPPAGNTVIDKASTTASGRSFIAGDGYRHYDAAGVYQQKVGSRCAYRDTFVSTPANLSDDPRHQSRVGMLVCRVPVILPWPMSTSTHRLTCVASLITFGGQSQSRKVVVSGRRSAPRRSVGSRRKPADEEEYDHAQSSGNVDLARRKSSSSTLYR